MNHTYVAASRLAFRPVAAGEYYFGKVSLGYLRRRIKYPNIIELLELMI